MRPIALDRRALLTTIGAALLASTGLTSCTSVAALDPVGSPVSRRRGSAASIDTGTVAVRRLAGELYGKLAVTSGNLAYSPFSVALALGMTVVGARGTTESQMLGLFGVPDTGTLSEGLGGLAAYLSSLAVDRHDTKVEVDIVDQLFAQTGIRWQQPFLDELARDYGAGIETVDFVTATEAARSAINRWTSDHTAGLIRQIVPDGAIDSTTRLVLVNALHLLAKWDVAFNAPQPAAFHLDSGTSVQVPTMRGGVAMGYARGDGWESAILPYRNAGPAGLAMTVVLPAPGRLDEVEAVVARGHIDQLIPRSGGASVTMPAWSVRSTVPLTRLLESLGMVQAFSDAADFSGMTLDEPLELSAVLHQAVVKVDQYGTEATAATAVVAEVSSAIATRGPAFVVDRPFLFVLHDTVRRTPLFVGRVADPSA